MYYETSDLLSITNLQIYDRDKYEQVKVIISYKSAMDSNTFLFESTRTKKVIVNSARLNSCLYMYKQ